MNLKQSRTTSAIESALNTGSGFALSLGCQWGFLVLVMGLPMTWDQNLAFALIMTAVSLARSYLWRRFFEWRRTSFALSPFMLAVLAERRRQIESLGYGAGHDDALDSEELAYAAAAYLETAGDALAGAPWATSAAVPATWPWDPADFKRHGIRGDLVAGAALALAAGDRHDRGRRNRRRKP